MVVKWSSQQHHGGTQLHWIGLKKIKPISAEHKTEKNTSSTLLYNTHVSDL
jgi:hypothetical protein